MRMVHAALAAAIVSFPAVALAGAAPPAAPAHLLFVDRTHISAADPRLALRLQQPTKGPWVLSPSEPWEAWAIAGYNTVVAGNGTRPHRLYYSCVEALHAPQRVCLAESKDGLTWTKPLLGLYNFNGSTANNILFGGEGCTPFLESPSRTDVPESQQWKAVCSNGEGTRGQAWASPDGLHFQPLPDSKDLTFSDDTQPNIFWDATLSKYVIMVRRDVGPHDSGRRRRLGRCITSNLSDVRNRTSSFFLVLQHGCLGVLFLCVLLTKITVYSGSRTPLCRPATAMGPSPVAVRSYSGVTTGTRQALTCTRALTCPTLRPRARQSTSSSHRSSATLQGTTLTAGHQMAGRTTGSSTPGCWSRTTSPAGT